MARIKESSPIKKDILVRVHVVYGLFILVVLIVLARLIFIMTCSEEIAVNASRLEGRIFVSDTIRAHRGNILARDGRSLLATSVFRYQVEMDYGSQGFDSLQTFREQSDSLAKLLSAYFKDKTPQEYARMMQREHERCYKLKYLKDTLVARSSGRIARWWDRLRGEEFQTVKLYDTIRDHRPVALLPREVDYNEWQTLKSYPILNWNMGMTYHLRDADQRIYPQGSLARRTIGMVSDIGKNFGIEYVMRDVLRGANGLVRRQHIARGFSGRIVDSENKEPEDGYDVVTTIDVEMQDVVDRALRNNLERQHALWGTALVMEVETGELLAIANLSKMSPGEYAEVENHALSKRMEPGSTFKLASLLALVDDAGKELDLTYDTGNGARVPVGNTQVQDSHASPPLNMKDAVAQSSNVYFAKAIYEAYKDNPERYINYLRQNLHLGESVGLDEYGARAPLLPAPGDKNWYKNVTLVNMGYGYAVEVTPLQTLTLYNAVANGGCMVAPRLIKEIRRGGKVKKRMQTQVLVPKICSQSSLKKVRECLEEVGTTGTAKRFFRDTTFYKIAGKTGTAQYAQNGKRYSDGYYLGTMVLYFPADKPKYTVLTALFTRRGLGDIYGAGLSGPVESDIVNYIYKRNQQWYTSVEPTEQKQYAHSVKGGDIEQIRKSSNKLMDKVESPQRSGWGRVSVDSMNRVVVTPIDTTRTKMPDVRGMGLKESLFLLESRGLQVSFTGKGAVCEQSIVPGATIQRGARVSLRLVNR